MSKLIIAVSARSLFNLEDGHKIFVEQGADAFDAYMRETENTPLRPGVAFNLVRKLLALNSSVEERDVVDVVLLSRNSPDAGLRVLNSVLHYGLPIDTAVFTRGQDRFSYAKALGAHLFLSATGVDVRTAIDNGVPAATLIPDECHIDPDPAKFIMIALDGDSVMFSDEAERINHLHGLSAFQAKEQELAHTVLPPGPLRPLLDALISLQAKFPRGECPLKVALVTARGVTVHQRVSNTLRSWGVVLDTAVYCGGKPKGPALKAMGASLHLDDTPKHIHSAQSHGVVGGHVPYGIVNSHVTEEVLRLPAPVLATA